MSGHSDSSHYKRKQNKEKPIIDDSNPVLCAFRSYSCELDAKNDRYERIIKLSRDITIESKRIIFLLHSIDVRKNNAAKILDEANQRLEKVLCGLFKSVAKELSGEDPYQFRGAYSPGLQEFIEAYTFMEYIKCVENENEGEMSDWVKLQKNMMYTDSGESEDKTLAVLVDPTEYILGLSDLTGELMRRCINSLGSGETDTCLVSCKVLQKLFTGYISLSVQRCREFSRKVFTMRQSLLKAENVCYNVKVRGGEAAKWGAVFDSKPGENVDEGFY